MRSKIPEVDRTICIGCGLCAEIAPHTFEMDRERLALVLNPDGDSEMDIRKAIAACPVVAISWQE
jgi:ferredoxin